MSRALGLTGAVLVAGLAGWAGLAAGRHGISAAMLADHAGMLIASWTGDDAMAADPAPAGGAVIYYRHPDGLARWSAKPATTEDGRDFVAVLASEDVSFDPGAPAPAPAPAPAAAGVERQILYYRNPMGLPDTSPVPKKDSMGMDYIPVFDGEDDDAGTVTVAAGRLQRTGVRTALATRAVIERQLRAPGVVMLDERRISVVALRADAFVESVADVTTGSVIAEGAPLVTLYSDDFSSAAALYAADLKARDGRSDGSRRRLSNLGLPEAVIERIAETGKPPETVDLVAPRGGVVLERMAVEGMRSAAGAPLFRIADTSVVWVMADVSETDIALVKRGATALIELVGLPGQSFTGTVDEIYPEVDPQTRTARLRIELPNPDGLLMANMYASVEITSTGAGPVVQVPDSAVIDSGDRQVVIRDLGEGRFAPQPVTLGARGGGMVEIGSGLAEGDSVVSSATFLLDAESNLRAALATLTAPEAAQ